MFNPRFVVFVLLAFLIAIPMLFSQGGEKGQIQGTVTDKSAAVVPGVTITIKNTATGFESVVVSEGSGSFRFPGLTPGTYSFKAELAGFGAYEVKSVIVNVGRTTDVNVVLQPAGTQTTVIVLKSHRSLRLLRQTSAASLKAAKSSVCRSIPGIFPLWQCCFRARGR